MTERQQSLLEDYRCMVSLDVFEGPLDLLLHVIRKHEIDIFDIPMAFVTARYLEYLDMMKDLNLNVAAEYLEMAAQLVFIKSRMMLPDEGADSEDDVIEDGPDPREELVRQLLEYQKYRTAADDLAERPQHGRDIFVRTFSEDIDSASEGSGLASPGLFALMEALKEVFERLGPEGEITRNEIAITRMSITARIHQILSRLDQQPRLSFMELFMDDHTRSDVVISFLALLEMAKMSLVRLHQVEADSEIHISAATDTEQARQMLADIRLEEE